jgi:gamma-glutamylcyclotransferase (GGCT)/AIG2-like uncharacterized protein YtfP
MPLVFGYGLLKTGGPLHPNLQLNGRFVGHCKTPPEFTMYRLAAEPGLVRQGTTAIEGEVWDVRPNTLSFLDYALYVPVMHVRSTVETPFGEAILYTVIIPPDLDLSGFEVIESVDWGSWMPYR